MKIGRPSKYVAGDLVIIGQLSKPHGLQGELRCRPETDFPERFLSTPEIEVFREGQSPRRVKIESARFHKELVLLKLEGVDTPEAAKSLGLAWVGVGPDEVISLDEGEYFHFELEGLAAFDPEGLNLGNIVEVLANPAHEIYRIQGPQGEILIPAVPNYVLQVDLEQQRVVVRPPVYED
jgi:16S rRNA processing protein RimM